MTLPTRIRFFNTYEPVTDIYRNIIPPILERGAAVDVFISRTEYRRGRKSLGEAIVDPGFRIKKILGPSGYASNRRQKMLVAVGYALHGALASLFARRAAINVFLTQPPFFMAWGSVLRLLRRQKTTLILMDLYPQVLFSSGKIRKESILGRSLSGLAKFAWRRADRIIVIGRCMRDLVLQAGIPAERIRTIPNWVDEQSIRPLANKDNPMRAELGLEGKFVVLYSGNMGEAHIFETILESASIVRDDDRIRFVMIGHGVRRAEIQEFVEEHQLANVMILDSQPEERMKYSQALGDIHYVCLRSEFTGVMVPSKTYGAFAAGRPVLYEGDKSGEIARTIEEIGVGCVVGIGDLNAMVSALRTYCDDSSSAAAQGRIARELVERELTVAISADRYAAALLEQLDV
jgi:glycosyltransferase involved in cell wall biosynthesis